MTGRLLTNTTSLQLEGAGVGVGLYPGYAMGNHACRWDRRSSELLVIIVKTLASAGPM